MYAIIDCGAWTTRVGAADGERPQQEVRTIYGEPLQRYKDVYGDQMQDLYTGNGAMKIFPRLFTNRVIGVNGEIDWDQLPKIWVEGLAGSNIDPENA